MSWIGVLLLSFAGAAAAFLVVYFFWIRRFSRRLFETQVMLYKIAALFQKAQKARSGRGAASPDRKPGAGRRAAASSAPLDPGAAAVARFSMSVEGRAVEIVEVDGQEVVRFEGDDLTEAQRSRILAYLRDEGFIS